MQRIGILSAALLSLALLGGCPSYLTMHSPRPTPPGQMEFVIGGAYQQPVVGATVGTGGVQPTLGGWPQIDLAARFGLIENLSLGVRFNTLDWGLGAEANIRFLNLDSVMISVAPGASISLAALALSGLINLADPNVSGSAFAYQINLPLLVGIPVDLGEQEILAIIGPKVTISNWNVSGQLEGGGGGGFGANLLQPGLMLGAEIPVSENLRAVGEADIIMDIDSGAITVLVGVSAHIGL